MGGLYHLQIIAFIINIGNSLEELCYSYSYGTTYCSGYCSGYYGYEYCIYYYSYSISYGGIAGIVIGCLIFLAIFISIIVAICSSCNKRAGQTGRVVHPTQGVSMATFSTAQNNYNTYQTPYSHGMNANMGYPPSSSMPPPPPGYNALSHPPPNYNAQPQSNKEATANSAPPQSLNIVQSAAPVDHQGHEYR